MLSQLYQNLAEGLWNAYSIFQNQGTLSWLSATRLASPGRALSCLVMPCLVLPGFERDAFSPIMKDGIHMGELF